MVYKSMQHLRGEWERCLFLAMVGLTVIATIVALNMIFCQVNQEMLGWAPPTASLQHIDTGSQSGFMPLADQHPMRARIPKYYAPQRGYQETTPNPPKPTRESEVPVPSPGKQSPVPRRARQLIYNGFIITPSRKVMAYFQDNTLKGGSAQSQSYYIKSNGIIATYRVVDITTDNVTLLSQAGETVELPRSTPLQIQ